MSYDLLINGVFVRCWFQIFLLSLLNSGEASHADDYVLFQMDSNHHLVTSYIFTALRPQ